MAVAELTPDMRREISRGMVALFKERVGRGPTEARTYFNEPLLTVLLFDTLTRAERSLADDDRASLVREVRRGFQGTMREEAIQMVERFTGKRVKAFMSDHSVYPDYAVECFVLEPGLPGDDSEPEHEIDQIN